MTTSSAQAVLDRMEVDEAFAERVKDAGGPEASLAVLGAEGFEVTRQEIRDATLDRYGDALTPDQLDAVSGGELIEGVPDIATGVGIGLAAGAAAGV